MRSNLDSVSFDAFNDGVFKAEILLDDRIAAFVECFFG